MPKHAYRWAQLPRLLRLKEPHRKLKKEHRGKTAINKKLQQMLTIVAFRRVPKKPLMKSLELQTEVRAAGESSADKSTYQSTGPHQVTCTNIANFLLKILLHL